MLLFLIPHFDFLYQSTDRQLVWDELNNVEQVSSDAEPQNIQICLQITVWSQDELEGGFPTKNDGGVLIWSAVYTQTIMFAFRLHVRGSHVPQPPQKFALVMLQLLSL